VWWHSASRPASGARVVQENSFCKKRFAAMCGAEAQCNEVKRNLHKANRFNR